MLIGIPCKSLSRSFAGALAVAFVLALAGCGGDDEEPSTSSETQSETTERRRRPRRPRPSRVRDRDRVRHHRARPPAHGRGAAGDKDPTSPEDQPGGGGDEEPARSLALFTGEGGRITPRVVRVPPSSPSESSCALPTAQEYGLTLRRRDDQGERRPGLGLDDASTGCGRAWAWSGIRDRRVQPGADRGDRRAGSPELAGQPAFR